MPRVAEEIVERIRRNVVIDENGCWIWQRRCEPAGYGQIKAGGRKRSAHVVSYESHVGRVPEGLELDHLCRVRNCVNPAHLEPVTKAENVQRSWRSRGNEGREQHSQRMRDWWAQSDDAARERHREGMLRHWRGRRP